MTTEIPELDLVATTEGDDDRVAILTRIADRGGVTGEMAKELLAARREREARLAAEAAADAADAALMAGEADWSDPAFRDGLRQQVLSDRARAASAAEAGVRAMAVAQFGATSSEVERRIRDFRDGEAAVAAYESLSDPLEDHPAYRSLARQAAERAAAREVALRGRSIMDDLAEAEAYIAAVKAKAAAE